MNEIKKETLPAIPGKKNPGLPLFIVMLLCFATGAVWHFLDSAQIFLNGQLTAIYWILGILCFFCCGEAMFVTARNEGLEENICFNFWLSKITSFIVGPIFGFVVFLLGKGFGRLVGNLGETWDATRNWLLANFVEVLIIICAIIALIFVFKHNRKSTIQKFGKDRVQ